MSDCVLVYDDVSIQVTASDGALVRWLDEFLAPSFCVTRRGTADWSISVVSDTARSDGLRKSFLHRDRQNIDCFTRDGHVLSFPAWEEDGDIRTVYDEHCNCFYRVSRFQQSVEMVCGGQKHHTRRALARLIRELATSHCLRRGDLQVHAATFARNGAAHVLAGPRRTGKTTYLTEEVIEGGAEFIANDRVMLQIRNSSVIARGMPTVIKLRSETVSMFPRLAAIQSERSFHREFLLEEIQPTAVEIPSDLGVKISRAQYSHLTGCKSVGARPVSSLLFPALSCTTGRTQFQRLSNEQASELLYDSLLVSDQPYRLSSLFCDPGDEQLDTDLLRRQCDAVVPSVNCYRVLTARRTCETHSMVSIGQRAA